MAKAGMLFNSTSPHCQEQEYGILTSREKGVPSLRKRCDGKNGPFLFYFMCE